jgi:hypothetical protein
MGESRDGQEVILVGGSSVTAFRWGVPVLERGELSNPPVLREWRKKFPGLFCCSPDDLLDKIINYRAERGREHFLPLLGS